jgi:hypothetical protein
MLKRSVAGILGILILILFMVSCIESGSTTFKVDYLEFSTTKNDSLNVYYTDATSPLMFSGTVELIDGRCDILIVNPEADTVYNQTYLPGEKISINEEFDRINGYWKFKYWLFELDDELPYGNLEFEFTYEN